MRKPIAITLSKLALSELDELAKKSGFETRSRTIEEIILATSEIKKHYEYLKSLSPKETGRLKADSDHILIFLNKTESIIDRLSRFEKRKSVPAPSKTHSEN